MNMVYSSESKQLESKPDAKQKVTLYISPELHRDLKIRAAVEMEPMSVMAAKALSFYLDHPDVVEGVQGDTYQVHACPECAHPFVILDGEVKSLKNQASEAILSEPESSFSQANWGAGRVESSKQDELVPC